MALRKKTTLLVVHVTATPPSANIGVKEVRAMHKARGWADIGYHYVIRRNGKIEAGRSENQIGAHVEGFNSISVGVSLVGGVDAKGKPQDNKTPEQERVLEKLLRDLAGRYPGAKICGHRDLSPDKDKDGVIEAAEWIKACPCFNAIPWAAARGLPAAAISGPWGGSVADKPAPKGPDGRNAYLQRLLAKAVGESFGPIDGIIGDKTAKAIERFQKMVGLAVTRQFDKATVAKLRAMFE